MTLASAASTSVYPSLLLWGIVILICGAITLLKGHGAKALLGFLLSGLPWVWWSIRLARPDSWWATRFYDEAKLGSPVV